MIGRNNFSQYWDWRDFSHGSQREDTMQGREWLVWQPNRIAPNFVEVLMKSLVNDHTEPVNSLVNSICSGARSMVMVVAGMNTRMVQCVVLWSSFVEEYIFKTKSMVLSWYAILVSCESSWISHCIFIGMLHLHLPQQRTHTTKKSIR